MLPLTNLFSFLTILWLVSASDANCPVHDETSLVQVRQTLKARSAPEPDSQNSEADEISDEELDKIVTQLLDETGDEHTSEVQPEDVDSTESSHEDSEEKENLASNENVEQDEEEEDEVEEEEEEDNVAPTQNASSKKNTSDMNSMVADVLNAENDAHFHDPRVSQLLHGGNAAALDSKDTVKKVKLPGQCTAHGPCLGGNWGFCSGNKNDCERLGLRAIGFVKSCSGFSTCRSGYMVQCATCDSKFKSVEAPKPAPMPAPWKAPPPAPAAKSSSPTPPGPAVLPTAMPVYPAVKYDAKAVATATEALKKAWTALKAARATLNETTCTEDAIWRNITRSHEEEADAKAAFIVDRKSAVDFAKKRGVVNITLGKVQKKLADYFYIQKGAEEAAQLHLANAKNENSKKLYYSRKLVDLKYDKRDAQRNYEIGRAAVTKARADFQQAERMAFAHSSYERSENNFHKATTASGVGSAKTLAIKTEREAAYIASSIGRNESNIPPWGG